MAFLVVSHSADRGLFPALDPFIGEKNVIIEGIVTGQPDDRGIKLQLVVETEAITTVSGSIIPVIGRILVTDRNMYVIPDPGDHVRIRGMLERAEANTSYERFLRMRDIGAVIDVRGIEILGQADAEPFTRLLWHIRSRFERQIKRAFPDPSAGLLTGLLTGANGALTPAIEEEFRRTGLSHIVAISGSNITIILSLMGSMLFFLPLRWRFVPLAVGIIVFTLFVGASASVIRAAVTGIIGLVALQTGRQNDARIATAWTACIMLLWNPWMLWADAGFQLSFLAVIGLIELTPFLEPLLKWIPEAGGIREALTATLAAQFTAVPWGVRLFGSLPLISPLANILVAPLLPIGMLFGFLAVLAQYIDPLFARMIGLPAMLLLDTVIATAHILSNVPGAVIGDLQISSAMMWIYYLLLTAAVIWFRRPAVQKHGNF
jgi:competence protein ComEC